MSLCGDDPEIQAILDSEWEAEQAIYDGLFDFVDNTDGLELTHWILACPELYEGTYRGRKFLFRERHDRWYLMWGEGPAWLVDEPPKWYAEARPAETGNADDEIIAFGNTDVLPKYQDAGHLRYAIKMLDAELARLGETI